MKTFPTKEAYLAAKAERERITNPPKAAPKFDAVRVLRKGQYARRPALAGDLVPVWPSVPAAGFLTMDEARELIQSGLAAPATADELAAFLDANENGREAQ